MTSPIANSDPSSPGKPVADARAEKRDWLLCDLIADAITAAHVRVSSGSQADSVQFLYSFLDYFRLALPGVPHLIIARSGADRGLSTATGKPLAIDSSKRDAGAHLFENSTHAIDVLVQQTAESPHRCSVGDILEQIRNMTKQRACGALPDIGDTLTSGLDTVLHPSVEDENAARPAPNATPATGNGDAVRTAAQLATLIHDRLATTLILAASKYVFVFRYWGDGEWVYLPFGFTAKTDAEGVTVLVRDDNSLPRRKERGLIRAADAAFRTGFVQLEPLEGDTSLFAVPCHFGGIPWLAIVQEILPNDRDNWSAYTTYRDVIPVLTDAVRRAAWSSLLEQMGILFFSAIPRGTAADVQERIHAAWEPLMRVYPIPAPRLMEALVGDGAERELLPIAGRLWRTVFSRDTNPFFPLALRSGDGASGQWERLSRTRLERGFVTPTRARLLSEQARVNTELAENVYAIGHPLKHRLGKISGAYQTVRNFSKTHCPKELRARLDGYTREFDTKVQAVTNTAQCMDMMAELSRRQGKAWEMERKKDFLVESVYPIFTGLVKIVNDVQPRLHIEYDNQSLLERALVTPSIPTSPRRTRLFDAFFNDVLYELVTNAEDKVPDDNRLLRVAVRDLAGECAELSAPAWCLEFVNTLDMATGVVNEANFKSGLGLTVGKWNRWNRSENGPKGGLRLIAVILHATGCGEVWAKPELVDKHGEFRIAITLPIDFSQEALQAELAT